MPLPSTRDTVADSLPAPSSRGALPLSAVTARWEGHVVEAIKLVRLERNRGVQEAKVQVDTYFLHHPVLKRKLEQTGIETREGVLRWLTFPLVGGIGLAYLPA